MLPPSTHPRRLNACAKAVTNSCSVGLFSGDCINTPTRRISSAFCAYATAESAAAPAVKALRKSRRIIPCQLVMPALSQARSEEHTSELQSRQYLVCRLLLEKKKKTKKTHLIITNLPNTTKKST